LQYNSGWQVVVLVCMIQAIFYRRVWWNRGGTNVQGRIQDMGIEGAPGASLKINGKFQRFFSILKISRSISKIFLQIRWGRAAFAPLIRP
jgi:hypothetical protein